MKNHWMSKREEKQKPITITSCYLEEKCISTPRGTYDAAVKIICDNACQKGLVIQCGSAVTKGIVIQAAASQTANLLEIQDSAGTVRFAITADYKIKGDVNVLIHSISNQES